MRQTKPKTWLKMNALVESTGVRKSTILYYFRQGLLPEPVKTIPNMAYYDPASVERIRLIQQMQERHRLTLSEIKRYRVTGRLPYQEDTAATIKMAKIARLCQAYVIDRLFQHRVAAAKDLKDLPAPAKEERDPWID
jgi:DNA-binding transcriptional MerR regulator